LAKKRRSSKSSGSADVFNIDFSKEVEGGGGGVRVPENDYKLKILKLKKIRASEKDTPGIAVTVKIVEGKFAGKKLTDRLWITPKSLWRLRSLLEALGMEVPKKALKLPAKKIVGKEVGATIIDDDPYNGRIKSKIGDWIDLETLADLDDEDEDEDEDDLDEDGVDEDDEEEEDEDEEDDEDEDEDEDDEDEDDLDEMDRKELKAYIKENELDVKITKKMDEDDIREAISSAGDEDEDDDEDEDEDDLDLDEL
jgi:hypothetical protein